MKYRAEIDGLRAIAVIPVILFHAGFELFSGGFVGVDLFFVISGYLITTILIEDLDGQRFSVFNFYERRARRILPALFFVILVCIPFAWVWMLPNQMKDFSQSLVAVGLFASNVLFWLESGYFDPVAEEKPLLHTWSLAAEEQYYLLFPIFLIIVWGFGRRKVFWMIVLIATISLLISEWGWRNQATANFYLTHSRAWELLAGSIAAFVIQKRGVQKNNVLSLLGLLAVFFSIIAYDQYTPFPSLYTLVPVLGVVLLILFGHQETLSARFLSNRAFVGIGLVSYSAYLWHQPLFAFARIRLHEPSEWTFLVLAFLSLIIAGISWRFVEQPFRSNKDLIHRQSTVFICSIAGILVLIVGGLIGNFSGGFKDATDERRQLSELSLRMAVNHGMSSECDGAFTTSVSCSNSEAPSLVLWGDSFAMHLYQGLYASDPDLNITQHTLSGCSPILSMSRFSSVKGYDLTWARKCLAFNESVYQWLKNEESVEFVVLSSPFGWVSREQVIDGEGVIYNQNFDLVVDQFSESVKKINSLGVGVVVVSPTPRSGSNTGSCLQKKYKFQSNISCDFNYDSDSYSHAFIKAIEQDVNVYWLSEDICSHGICRAEIGGNFIYRDASHLSQEGSEFLGRTNDWYSKMRLLALQE